jgi:outer membrane protein OmpA-like peptidoglycan-associated protein
MKQATLLFAIFCNLVALAQEEYTIRPIPSVNSPFDDVVCTFFHDRLMFTTNDRQDLLNDFQWNERRIFHMMQAKRGKDFSDYEKAEPLFPWFASNDEGPASWNPHDSTLYFSSASNYGTSVGNNLKIFSVKWNGRHWSEPKALTFCTPTADFAHPAYDPALKLLVFSSNKSGGMGQMDLWFTYKIPGGWTIPANFGLPVNTPGSEVFPSVFEGDVYYASNGQVPGVGYDLFVSKEKDQWASTVQLPAPVNSAQDDLCILHLNESKGFVTSRRSGGLGGDDIYLFEKRRSTTGAKGFVAQLDFNGEPASGVGINISNGLKETVLDAITDASGRMALDQLDWGEKYKIQLQGVEPSKYVQFVLHIIDPYGRIVRTLRFNAFGWCELELLPFDYSQLNLVNNQDESILTIRLEGQVYVAQPGDVGKGEKITIVDAQGEIVAVAFTEEAGQFRFGSLNPKSSYTFRLSESSAARHVALTDKGKNIVLPVLRQEAIYQRTVPTEVIELVNEKQQRITISASDLFVINRIYYEYNSALLTEEAKGQLDQLIQILKQNNQLRVELLSHTDSRGEATSNKRLSERRAEAAVHYLVSRGVARERLVPRGMGEMQLLNRCDNDDACSEAEHAINRRTEIKLLSR